jgi:ATP-dependent Clp protease ATP-binding subunit ClpC
VNTSHKRSVYRYFEPADSFVQILTLEGGGLEIEVEPGLNRAQYRRLVVQACMPEWREDFGKKLNAMLPDDPLLAEELLYQLCIEVNPTLDIHTVRLGAETNSKSKLEGRAVRGEAPRTQSHEQFCSQMKQRAVGLEERLGRSILGQTHAIEHVARAVRKAAAGLGVAGRPLGAFLFLGRTGTGKSELAKTLAALVYGRNDHNGLVKIDCAEYGLAHEYSKLIGAPPGYVGHEDGGQLTEMVLKQPESVVLFDEIEKAHPRMHSLLLSILEDGVLTDNKGRRVSFERTLILFTSNAGAQEMVSAQRQLGFVHQEQLGMAALRSIATEALERQFAPELLGRIDETIVFSELDRDVARSIAQVQLTGLAARARQRGLRVAFTPAVARWVAERGWSPASGAREVRRVITREVESRLAEVLIAAEAPQDLLWRVRVERDELCFVPEA